MEALKTHQKHRITNIYTNEKYMIDGINVLDYIGKHQSKKAIDDFIKYCSMKKKNKRCSCVCKRYRIWQIEKIYRIKLKYEYELELIFKNNQTKEEEQKKR